MPGRIANSAASAQVATSDPLFHVDDNHDLEILVADAANDPVGAFMHLAQSIDSLNS